ncbi:hypothetical protein FB451DRAFT_1447639 [Mycena latifolia]|nr:hypothetical protein FB451DRAFT_1447639 [Mycena latifolia]
MMSSLDTLFTRLSRLRFSLCSLMTWPPNCFFDSPAYIGSLMCASAAKKAHKLQKVSKVQASRSIYNPGQGETAPLAPFKLTLSLSAPGPDVPTPTAPPAEPPVPPSDPPGEALVLNMLVQVMLTALKSRGLALEQIRTTGACTEADSGSVGPPAPPCSPCTKALTLAHHLALLTVFDDTENSDVCVGGVGGAGGGAGGGREVGGGMPQRRAGPAEKGTWKYCHDLLPSDTYPGLLGGFYSYTVQSAAFCGKQTAANTLLRQSAALVCGKLALCCGSLVQYPFNLEFDGPAYYPAAHCAAALAQPLCGSFFYNCRKRPQRTNSTLTAVVDVGLQSDSKQQLPDDDRFWLREPVTAVHYILPTAEPSRTKGAARGSGVNAEGAATSPKHTIALEGQGHTAGIGGRVVSRIKSGVGTARVMTAMEVPTLRVRG